MLKNIVKQNKKNQDGSYHDENQYLHLISDILNEGEMQEGRNGNTKAVFGSAMHFTLENNSIPLLTTKKLAWKTCLNELLWFITGSTDNGILQEKKIKIWNGQSTRSYLDSCGLNHLESNDLGPIYGHQWRHFNAPYINKDADYSGKGIDQLQYVIDRLSDPEKRTSRRIIMSSWNPCQLNEMSLPPCHIMCQFNVIGNNLSCSLYQRSGDVGLGVPFNIASYCFLTHLLAHHCGLNAYEFVYYLGNSHIYDDHLESLSQQITKKPYAFPTISFKEKKTRIEDYDTSDFIIDGYEHHEPVNMKMRI